MTYTGRIWRETWTCNPNGDTYNDKVGRILSGGANLKDSLRAKALGTLSSNQEQENSRKEVPRRPDSNKSSENSVAKEAQGRFCWVDPSGKPLMKDKSPSATETPVSKKVFSSQGSTGLVSTINRRQQQYLAMDPNQRSMYTWRKIAPGASESAYMTPTSTFMDHFNDLGPKRTFPDKRYFLKKTEFTDYTEVKLKSMSHL
mmetsp:Transcript_13262/g.23492  ORF Transcript_13262/g.23492 Transcript_13262/m.23492 type:complete len:201 (-) Transcript_13262:730-1332(-)